jgi:phosphoesterase RecJ-like protein
MNNSDISLIIKEKAPLILAEIMKAKSILLHCHPSPDPDSVGSSLAMKFALEQLGKKVTVIKGDSEIPQAFMHFPGAKEIVQKNFFEIDLQEFDLFIILDTGSIKQISRFKPIQFPLPIKSILIDHHISNTGFADINLIEPNCLATCLILNDLFKEWGIKTDSGAIASNLFIGMYTDTGAFKYPGVSGHLYEEVADLVKYIPNVSDLITKMEYSNTKGLIDFEAAALSNIEIIGGGHFALSIVPNSVLKTKNILSRDVRTSEVSSFMLTVSGWDVVASVAELEPNVIKFSFRSKDVDKYDVAKLTAALGGGGHKAAAGLILKMSLAEAKALVVSKAKELYNL